MEKKEEETEAMANKTNLESILVDSYDRLMFLSKSIRALGEDEEKLGEPDCVVLKDYLFDVAKDIEEGSRILEGFDLVSK